MTKSELEQSRLDDWRVLRARQWDWHDQHVIVRPYVDALIAELVQARRERDAAIAANYPTVCECGKEVMVDGGVDKALFGVVVAERDGLYDMRFGSGRKSTPPDPWLSFPGGVGGTDEDHD